MIKGKYDGEFFPQIADEKKKVNKSVDDVVIYNDKIEILKQILNILKDL